VLRFTFETALSLLGSVPDIGTLDVIDAKWANQSTVAP
jgi:hypothetical protein